MLCSKDKKQGHEGMAMELALTYVFASIGKVRPFAIVIDKYMTSLNSINEVIDKDVHRWTIRSEGRVQVVGRVLLCHFHVMKAWSENFLTHVSILDKESLWRSLHILMHCSVEEYFDDNLKKLYEDFQHISNVVDYIDASWAGECVPWRRLWQRFGRLFPYDGMNTINHIERHWNGLSTHYSKER
jgi:hypothetical protein